MRQNWYAQYTNNRCEPVGERLSCYVIDFWRHLYVLPNTFVLCYPQDLYPVEEDVPCRLVEIPIWPELNQGESE